MIFHTYQRLQKSKQVKVSCCQQARSQLYSFNFDQADNFEYFEINDFVKIKFHFYSFNKNPGAIIIAYFETEQRHQ